jgi:uncharacterized protein YkwD
VPPLVMNPLLRQAAQAHSEDMLDNNFFSHTGSNGSSHGQRISATGYRAATTGENIAAGRSTADATMNQWMNSSGHCRNLMSADFTEIGVGHANGSGARYRDYWTQKFGRPR